MRIKPLPKKKTSVPTKHHSKLSERKDVQKFIAKMAKEHNFDKSYLNKIFNNAKLLPKVVAKISHPYEKQPWDVYRKHFVNQKRITWGAAYWRHHYKALHKAEKIYGVPVKIITAIVGIESLYGKYTANYSVLDALTTLSFNYPARANFFKYELGEYLLLTRELNLNPHKIRGSYAGAMGLPQFMPSSYRQFAVDFNGNHKKDILHNTDDVIGSVANFLTAKGWQKDMPIVVPAKIVGNKYTKLLNNKLATKYTLKKLKKYGVTPRENVPANLEANLVELTYSDGSKEYWLGFNNFFVITHYNTSTLYAMTAAQLGERIAATHLKRLQSRKQQLTKKRYRHKW